MTLTPKNSGWIEVICGPMFSGKTEELIRRLVRAQIAKQKVAIFKPTSKEPKSPGPYVTAIAFKLLVFIFATRRASLIVFNK